MPAAKRKPSHRGRLGAVAALAVILGCLASPVQSARTAAWPASDCASIESVSLTRPAGTPVLDWLIVPTARTLSINRLALGGWRYATKLPIWVRSNRAGSLVIRSAAAAWTLGSVRTPTPAISIPSCPRSNQWVLYTARLHANAASCVSVAVRTTARTATVRFPVGKPCAR